jgi:membrane protein
MAMLSGLWSLVKQAGNAWLEDRASSMGAALAYYAAFSMAPLLIIAIGLAGVVFGRDAAEAAIVAELQGLLGKSGGEAVQSLLDSTSGFGTSIVAIVVGVSVLAITATTAFVELQDDLDRIWKAPPRVGNGVIKLIRSRLISLGMVVFVGFLLTVSLLISAAVTAFAQYALPGVELALRVSTFALSFAVITVLFAIIYKVLPNVAVAWQEVWIGAAVTALLFEIGKELIGLYIGKAGVESSFGAAGPFVVLMVWIYYSTQIFLFGAEFTYAHAEQRRGAQRMRPAVSGPVPSVRATNST